MFYEQSFKISTLDIFTIGHSTRTFDEFVHLLKLNRIELLIDVRSYPGSRMNPQFNKEAMPGALREYGIEYAHLFELGGRRGVSKSVLPSQNTAWENASFRNYADYALAEEFEIGYARLVEFAEMKRAAIMCSEAVWWRCHRRIITDYLLARGVKVHHIMSDTSTVEAEMTKFAVVTEKRKVLYPGEQYELAIGLLT